MLMGPYEERAARLYDRVSYSPTNGESLGLPRCWNGALRIKIEVNALCIRQSGLDLAFSNV
jgi:hypothetical protein